MWWFYWHLVTLSPICVFCFILNFMVFIYPASAANIINECGMWNLSILMHCNQQQSMNSIIQQYPMVPVQSSAALHYLTLYFQCSHWIMFSTTGPTLNTKRTSLGRRANWTTARLFTTKLSQRLSWFVDQEQFARPQAFIFQLQQGQSEMLFETLCTYLADFLKLINWLMFQGILLTNYIDYNVDYNV